MRKIILNLAVSLDGFIAGVQGEFDWCYTDADYGMEEFFKRIDCTLMGRKTYEVYEQYSEPPPELTNYVFSRTLKDSKFKSVQIIKEDIVTFTENLKKGKGKNVWLAGGAEIIHPLLQHDLIDEMMLSIHPIVLGDGIPLFKKGMRKHLTLTDSITYPSGLVQLIYKKK